MHAPVAARRFQPGPVLPPAELRVARAARADGTRARDGRPRADRRVGRSRARAWSRRSCSRWAARRDLCALLQARRAGRADGPDRHADRDRRRTRPSCSSAAASATRCCSRSARRCATPARRCSTSPATSSMVDRYKVEDIEAAADVVVWCCDEAPGFAPTRPQDALRRQHRAGDARVRERRARRAADRVRATPTASSPSARTG